MERHNEWARDTRPDGDRPRVAVLADGLGTLPALAETVAQLRERGVPGFELDVFGPDAGLDRGLPARSRYDLIHVCGPGPSGVAVLPTAWAMGVPVTTSVHAELPAGTPVEAFLRGCRRVLSPSRFADQWLRAAGVGEAKLGRWEPGVDLGRFSPAYFSPEAMPAAGAGATARINVLHAGSLTAAKGVGLLADAFLMAHDRDPRLHLVLAGRGPEEDRLRHRLGVAATFLGWLDPDELARALASADLFVLAGAAEACGRIVLEAQASGVPVLAVDSGGASELIESGRSGCLVEPSEVALAQAIRWLARRATVRERLATGGLVAVRPRTWERSLSQLADGWTRALAEPAIAEAPPEVARVA
jgi:glycosyltransferase involved in cell wall biosynthesis